MIIIIIKTNCLPANMALKLRRIWLPSECNLMLVNWRYEERATQSVLSKITY